MQGVGGSSPPGPTKFSPRGVPCICSVHKRRVMNTQLMLTFIRWIFCGAVLTLEHQPEESSETGKG